MVFPLHKNLITQSTLTNISICFYLYERAHAVFTDFSSVHSNCLFLTGVRLSSLNGFYSFTQMKLLVHSRRFGLHSGVELLSNVLCLVIGSVSEICLWDRFLSEAFTSCRNLIEMR